MARLFHALAHRLFRERTHRYAGNNRQYRYSGKIFPKTQFSLQMASRSSRIRGGQLSPTDRATSPFDLNNVSGSSRDARNPRRVQNAAASTLCGTDIHRWHGPLGGGDTLPIITGHEPCGIVERSRSWLALHVSSHGA